MKRLSCVALIIMAVFLMSVMLRGVSAQEGQQQYVDSTGMAAIINNDMPAARDRAIEDARRKAVEQVVGTMVDSETLVQNFQLVNDRIYSQTTGFICGDKVTNESHDSNTYTVTIHACVKEGNLENDLLAIGICLRRIGNPRTMLMIAEQNMGEDIHGWWQQGSNLGIVEQKIMEAFNDKGFQLIDPMVAQGKIRAVRAVGGEPDPSYAVQVGKAFDAEYVVIGKALVTCKAKDQYGFFNCYANITTRIVKVDNGRIFGTGSAAGKQAHIEANESGVRALQKAADELSPKLIKAVTTRCEKETGGGNEYKIIISNATSLAKLRPFIEALNTVRGVSSVTRRGFGNGQAELEVMCKCRAEDLADEIEDKTGATVTGQSANTLNVRLK